MPTHSKRYETAAKTIDVGTAYALEEAIKLAKESSKVKFDATVELHIRLGIDPKKSDQQLRGTLILPHGTGKTKRVAAFVEPEKEAEAKAAGAEIVGGEDLVAEIIKTGKVDFDVAVATPIMMPKIAKIAKTLGQRGVMPNPKTETVGTDVKKMVTEQRGGKISIKNDSNGIVHQAIGKVSFDDANLIENATIFIDFIKKNKPSASKGIYLRNVTLSTSMGPGITLSV